MWLACFLGSLCMLGVLHALYGLAVSLRLLDPRLYRRAAQGILWLCCSVQPAWLVAGVARSGGKHASHAWLPAQPRL